MESRSKFMEAVNNLKILKFLIIFKYLFNLAVLESVAP